MKKTRMVFGFHAVQARLRALPKSIIEVMLDENRKDRRAEGMLALLEVAGTRVLRVPKLRLDGMDASGRHQGLIALVEEVPLRGTLDDLLDGLQGPPLLLILDGVTDPHNLGACLRVADATGVNAVIAPKDRAVGINAVVSKVASGAAEVMPYFMVANLARTIGELKERDIWVVGTDERADVTLYQTKFPRAIAWVLGAEGKGMRRLTRERCDQLVRIPMLGSVGSLNVSVASGICLYKTRDHIDT